MNDHFYGARPCQGHCQGDWEKLLSTEKHAHMDTK